MQKLDTYIDEHGGTPKAPEQTKGKTRDGGGVTTGDVPQGYSLTKEINTSSHTGLSYPWGQCTWFVYNRGKEVGVSFGKYMGKWWPMDECPRVSDNSYPNRTLRSIF